MLYKSRKNGDSIVRINNLKGYLYHFKSVNGISQGWLPFSNIGTDQAKFAYSLLTKSCEPTAVETIVEDNGLVKVFPNPSSDIVNIDISGLDIDKKLSIECLNARGRLVKILFDNEYYSGVTNILFEHHIEHLPTGLYFYKIIADQQLITKCFIKQ